MNQLEVQIMGQGYRLSCPEGGEARLREAVERVDSAMCRIRDAGKVRARDRIAVLAALNLAFELTDRVLSTPPQQHPAPSSAPAEATASPEGTEDPRLAVLLARLDRALNEDGQLL